VRVELDHGLRARVERELLLDLGEVPVLHEAVGLRALGPLDVEVGLVDLAAGAAHAAEAVDDDVLAGDDPVPQERRRAGRGCWSGSIPGEATIFAPVFHSGPSAPAGRSGRAQELRGGVLAVVPLVGRQVGDPEVRAQVDDPLARAGERPRELRRRAVGQREEEERDVARRQRRRVGGHEPIPRSMPRTDGDHLGERACPRGCARSRPRAQPWGAQEQLHERFARIARRAYDADFHGKGTIRSDESKIQQ
jgi:hypothetical protein